MDSVYLGISVCPHNFSDILLHTVVVVIASPVVLLFKNVNMSQKYFREPPMWQLEITI